MAFTLFKVSSGSRFIVPKEEEGGFMCIHLKYDLHVNDTHELKVVIGVELEI